MSNSTHPTIEELAEVFKALSNPNRLRIVTKLLGCCRPGNVVRLHLDDRAACIGDLGADLGIGKSTTSHHIKELKRVGLIKTRREGQKVHCWIDAELIQILRQFFSE